MTAADRPSVTDNARACHMTHPHTAHRWDVEDREPLRYECAGRAETTTDEVYEAGYKSGYHDGYPAGYGAARAETTTEPTDEAAAQVIRAHFWDASNEQLCTCGESPTGYDGDQDDDDQWLAWANWHTAHVAQALHARGLLATARTRPSREQIAKAIHNSDIASGRSGTYRTGEGYYENADAVLALLADQPETTTEWAVRANDRWDQRVYPVADEQAARADRRAVNLVVVRREVTAWTEADR